MAAVAATDGAGSCSDGLCEGGGGPGGVGIESGQLEAAAASFWASLFFFFLAFLQRILLHCQFLTLMLPLHPSSKLRMSCGQLEPKLL